MIIIDSKENASEIVKEFLESNIIYKVCDNMMDDKSYLEADSISGNTLLVNRVVLNHDIFLGIIARFIESREMLFDQDMDKINYLVLKVSQNEGSINVKGTTCEVSLFTSVCDKNILVPTEGVFIQKSLNAIDNGKETQIIINDNGEFLLLIGSEKTIKFDRLLLDDIEEFVINSKHNGVYKLERKKENEK